MWPLTSRSASVPPPPPPSDYVEGSFRARFDIKEKMWKFVAAGLPFGVESDASAPQFDPGEIARAEETARMIHRLLPEIEAKVDWQLEGWIGDCDPKAKQIRLVTQTRLENGHEEIVVDCGGDESWRDYVATVVILEGKVTDSYGAS